jgi:hypothetical protein
MAVDRFTRFKILRALWARAKNLLAWIYGPKERDERLRMQRWLHINIAERHIRDGIIRGTGDPDSYVRPSDTDTQATQAEAWRRQLQAQREWYAASQRYEQAQQQRQNGRR